MAAENLTAPLGIDSKAKGAWRVRLPLGVIGIGILTLLISTVVVWMSLVDDPLGGEPMAIVDVAPISTGVTEKNVEVVKIAPASPPKDGNVLAETERPTGETLIEAVEQPGSRQARGPVSRALPAAPIPKIIEQSRHGPLPKTASDGSRPLDLYAAPTAVDLRDAPQVAIIVGDLGLSQTGTQQAIRTLPKQVTLAFAPYGGSLDRWMRRARSNGHEILLQVPLEPFDFPDNDPGPHTLLTTLSPERNVDRLHWVMSRLTNYVGVINYMGARFTSTAKALAPFMEEIGRRGLMFVDDGSSPRSLTESVADATRTPFAKGQVIIDAAASAADIDTRLLELETIARTTGSSVGVASALPITVKRIAEWAKTLESRGVVLVPVTTVMRKKTR